MNCNKKATTENLKQEAVIVYLIFNLFIPFHYLSLIIPLTPYFIIVRISTSELARFYQAKSEIEVAMIQRLA